MTSDKKHELRERLKKVMIHKINRLREAPERYPDEEEEEDYGADPAMEPEAPAPEAAPVQIPGMDDNPAATDPADDGGNPDTKIRRAKVDLFFKALDKNPTIKNYLRFTNPLEQAEAIERFAQLVGVRQGQIFNVIKTLRQISQEPQG